MDPNSQEYIDLYSYVASLTPEVAKAMKAWDDGLKLDPNNAELT